VLTLLSEAESNKRPTETVRACHYPAGSGDLTHAETFNIGTWEILDLALSRVELTRE
jgi:hypothetical protein